MEYDIATRCLYGDGSELPCEGAGALSFPIYQSATFSHRDIGHADESPGHGYDYSRMQNPTREQLEKVVAALEYGRDCLAFSSGMAAVAAVMELFAPGDHILTDSDLYGGSVRLFQHISQKNGVHFTHTDLRENAERFVTPATKAIFVETPTNPMMHVVDLEKLCQVAREYHLLLIVDNTFLSPYFQNPLELGADIVLHSGTKYLGGHNDTLAGFLITKDPELGEHLRFIAKTTGGNLAPFDSWLVLRGIKTLAVRMEKAQENALAIVEWLQSNPRVDQVFYPGIKGTPDYAISCKQARGFGGMISFSVESEALALSILRNVQLIHFAESLGGVETLITYPITQTHADVPQDILKKNGVSNRLLRLSVGIESLKDIQRELERLLPFTSSEN